MESVVAQDTPTRSAPERLGPISPELVLVDPVLAELARDRLPEPPRAQSFPEPTRPVPPPPRRGPRRLRRTVALAVAVFTAGAVAPQFLGKREPGAPESLEVRPRPVRTESTPKPEHRSTAPARRVRDRATSKVWAANVLGVTADVSRRGVNIVWKRPIRSDHVVVVRKRDPGETSVVFRGRAASYRDATARSCSEYRYTIVNYDRRGRRSTGVLTSVVTPGCA